MATYAELNSEIGDGNLFIKVKVACFIAAGTIQGEGTATVNHTNRLLWAKAVYANPEQEARRMMAAVLAANQAATLASIQTATDSQVQTAVNAAVDLFANGQP